MKINVIYATWPNSPGGVDWYKLAGAVKQAGLAQRLRKSGFQVNEHSVASTGETAADLRHAFELSAQIAALVKKSHDDGSFPVIICGSCAVSALGAVTGLGGEETGVLWLDAHPDLNTPETTMNGVFEGMAVSLLLGEAWQTMSHDIAGLTPISRRNLCFHGVRNIDPPEAAIINEEGLPIVEDADGAIDALGSCEQVHIHLDMDVHAPDSLRVRETGNDGGPSPEQIRQFLSEVTAAVPVAALTISGLDPDAADKNAIPCVIDHVLALCEAQNRKAAQEKAV